MFSEKQNTAIRIASSASCRLTSLINAMAQCKAALGHLINTPCILLINVQCLKMIRNLFLISCVCGIWCNIRTLHVKYLHFVINILYFCDLFHVLLTHWLNFGSVEYITYLLTYVQFSDTTKTSTASVTATFRDTFRLSRTKCPVHVVTQIFTLMSLLLQMQNIMSTLL